MNLIQKTYFWAFIQHTVLYVESIAKRYREWYERECQKSLGYGVVHFIANDPNAAAPGKENIAPPTIV